MHKDSVSISGNHTTPELKNLKSWLVSLMNSSFYCVQLVLVHLCFMGDLTPVDHVLPTVSKLAHVASPNGCGLATREQVPAYRAFPISGHITYVLVTH